MANSQKCKQVFISSRPASSTLTDNGDGTLTFHNGIDPDVTFNNGAPDTDTRIRFVQVLPSGEWEWEVYNVITNVVLSTFNTPAIIHNTVSSPTGSVDVLLNGNNYELEVDVNLPIFSTYTSAFNALGAGKKFRYSENNIEGVPSPNNSTLAYT